MPIQVTKAVAVVRYRAVYTCSTCGARGTGDTERRELEAESLAALTLQMMDLKLESRSMPVGWASYAGEGGKLEFRCEQCVS